MEPVRASVVDGADQRDRDGAAHDPARLAADRQEEQSGDDHRRQDREAAQARNRPVVEVSLARIMEHAEPAGEPRRRRRGCERDHGCDEERPEGIELVHLPEPSPT
jgi:hypothetical protein